MTTINIIDRPCGWGKTTELFTRLKNTQGPFIVVVPLLSECVRIEQGCNEQCIPIEQAGHEDGEKIDSNKTDHVRKLILERKNIVCTHALYSLLGAVATEQTTTISGTRSVLSGYSVFIDEVINPFDHFTGVNENDFKKVYTDQGLVTIQKDGLVLPTPLWDELFQQGVTTYSRDLYLKCKASSLYCDKERLFIITVPLELLTRPKLVTVLTFLSEGSFFAHYLRKLKDGGLDIELNIDMLHPETLAKWKKDVRQALIISSIPALEKFQFSYNKQTKFKCKSERTVHGKRIATGMRKFRERGSDFKNVNIQDVMITCVKSNWLKSGKDKKPESSYWSKDSRMFGQAKLDETTGHWVTTGARWVANQTRGTNDHSHCTHAIYLYDQNPNPNVTGFLDLPNRSKEYHKFADAYALTEFVQWLFRCQIRKGGYGLDENGNETIRGERHKATVYIPSERMRNLFTNWLYEDGPAEIFSDLVQADNYIDLAEADAESCEAV